jgi:hypothetical protein
MIRRLLLGLTLAALLAADVSSAAAEENGFDAWLKGIMDAPGRHAGRHYREPRVPKAPKVLSPMEVLRHKMVTGAKLSDTQLKKLADSGDSLGAYNYAKRLGEAADPAELTSALRYYFKAVKGGRAFALRPMIRLLDTGIGMDDLELLAEVQALLEKKALKDPLSRDALVRYYRSGRPFGLDVARADTLIADAAKAGDSKAALDLAFALLTGVPEPEKVDEAKGYLQIAALSETLSIRTVAENLLRDLSSQTITVATETVQ